MTLPHGLTQRRAGKTDAAGIAEVINAAEAAHVPEPIRVGVLEVELWLGRALDALVVCDGDEVAAFAGAVPRGEALSIGGAVRPAATGRGIGAFLFDWSEARGRELGYDTLRASVLAGDDEGKALVLERGYAYVRSFYRMVIDLEERPPGPEWPPGIVASQFQPGEERVVHEAVEDTFAEHWGHVRRSFEEWMDGVVLEPDLIFFAREADEVAGVVICNEHLYGDALVGILGVRKRWRGRGLGRALLLQGFGALYDKGKSRIGLGVDAGNETGAVALYESVGMRIAGQEDVYQRRS